MIVKEIITIQCTQCRDNDVNIDTVCTTIITCVEEAMAPILGDIGCLYGAAPAWKHVSTVPREYEENL